MSNRQVIDIDSSVQEYHRNCSLTPVNAENTTSKTSHVEAKQCAWGVLMCRARFRVCSYEHQCFHHDGGLLFVINHSRAWCDLLSLHKSSILPVQHHLTSVFFTNHDHVVSPGSIKNSSNIDWIQHRVCTDTHVSKTLPKGMLILPSQKRSLDSEALAHQISHAGPSRSVIRRGPNCFGATVKALECADK